MSVIEDKEGTPTLKAVRIIDSEFRTSSLKGSLSSYSLASEDSKTSSDAMMKTAVIKEEIDVKEKAQPVPESLTKD